MTQAKTAIAAGLGSDVVVDQYSFPGVAACSYLSTVTSYLKRHHPKVAILEFWGNDSSATPCMSAPSQTATYYREYLTDLTTMTRDFVKSGAHVFIVGTVPDAAQVAAGDVQWDHLNQLYATIPGDFKKKVASFLNIQTVIETRSGAFTWYLPCLKSESTCDAPIPAIVTEPPAGNNIVRSSDGLHFCPRNPATTNPYYNFAHCDAYSSGTARYAGAIVSAVQEFLKHHVAPRFIGSPLPDGDTPPLGVPGQVDPYTGQVYPQPATAPN